MSVVASTRTIRGVIRRTEKDHHAPGLRPRVGLLRAGTPRGAKLARQCAPSVRQVSRLAVIPARIPADARGNRRAETSSEISRRCAAPTRRSGWPTPCAGCTVTPPMSAGSSRTTRCRASTAAVVTASFFSVSRMDPVSATPIGVRTTVTSTSAGMPDRSGGNRWRLRAQPMPGWGRPAGALRRRLDLVLDVLVAE